MASKALGIEITKRNVAIILGTTLVVGGVSYLLYRKYRNKRLMIAVNYVLENREAANGDIRDFGDVWAGDAYITKTTELAKKNGYPIILLNDSAITKYRKELYDFTLGGLFGWGTDENGIKSVFNKLRDKVAIAQVAKSFQDNYKQNLGVVLQSRLNEDENKELNDIVSVKPAFTKAIK